MKRCLCLLMLLLGLLLGLVDGARACTGSACASMGPRLASVSSSRGALLNLVLGSLAGSSLNLSVADWNALATGNVSLAATLNALQASTGASSPSTALTSNVSVAQLLTAAATAATGENKTTLAAALNTLKVPLQLLSGTVRLGDLLVTDGALGSTRLNALELVTGVIQLYNRRNVLSTPSDITVSGASLGLSGVATSVTLAAQVVEPPVFVCGPVGSTFHSASIRVKLGLELLAINLDVGALAALPLVSTISAQIGHLDLYLEIARADGVITSLNAITNAFSVQATPGVADLYLGTMVDSVFFNRSHIINAATDLGWSTIGAVTVNTITVNLRAKASARGSAAGATTLNFSGTYPQGGTASAGAGFVTTLLGSLMGNLQVSLSAGLGGLLTTAVTLALGPVLQLALPLVLQPVIDGLVNPLLELLGVRLGEVDVNAGGTMLICAISGAVYNDANHTAKLEAGEAGTGTTLYAKLLASGQSAGPALAVATVDPSTGAYSFGSVAAASYLIVVNGNALSSQVTPAAPSGWLPTEQPTLSLAATMTTADLTAQRFGLYRGSKLTGSVFKDTGLGAGTANNGIRDGSEAALVGSVVKLVDNAGSVTHDTTTSGDSGGYTLWIPYAAISGTLKVVHAASGDWVMVSASVGSTGGTYTAASASAGATVSFTAASGSVYTAVNFGVVPANRFEPDGRQQVLPGNVVTFVHSFTAGSVGTVGISAAGPGTVGWTTVLYADANCNGKVEPAELPVAASVPTVADQKICIVLKVAAPATAAWNSEFPVVLTAHFAYANSTLASDHLRNDMVSVGSATDTGLRLLKAVDRIAAVSGDVITYTITYTNQSKGVLTAVKITDATPAYTVFSSASCGAAPDAAISCAVSLAPAVGVAGRIEWTFTGSLTAGASGSVTLRVLLQ